MLKNYGKQCSFMEAAPVHPKAKEFEMIDQILEANANIYNLALQDLAGNTTTLVNEEYQQIWHLLSPLALLCASRIQPTQLNRMPLFLAFSTLSRASSCLLRNCLCSGGTFAFRQRLLFSVHSLSK